MLKRILFVCLALISMLLIWLNIEALAKVYRSWFDKLTTNGIPTGYSAIVRSP